MTTTVVQAITAIMGELPSIGKADRSPEGYQYRGIEAITSRLQPLMAKHGVIIVPAARVVEVVPSPAMRDGWQDVHMRVDWLIYGPAGDSIAASTCGIGRDRADKGANKAHTQALKYLLLSLFAIADRNDDPDAHDTRASDEPAQPTRTTRPARTTRSSDPADSAPSGASQLVAAFSAVGITGKADRLAYAQQTLGRDTITSVADLTLSDIDTLIERLTQNGN